MSNYEVKIINTYTTSAILENNLRKRVDHLLIVINY